MKLATYNVNGINGRFDVLRRWLVEAQPDVDCLQKLKARDDRFPPRELERLGYGAIWHGQKAWNGVAILARGKQPLETRRGVPGEPDDSHSRYIEAAPRPSIVQCLLPRATTVRLPRGPVCTGVLSRFSWDSFRHRARRSGSRAPSATAACTAQPGSRAWVQSRNLQ